MNQDGPPLTYTWSSWIDSQSLKFGNTVPLVSSAAHLVWVSSLFPHLQNRGNNSMYHIGLVIKRKNSGKMFSTESATCQKLNRCQLLVVLWLYWLPRCHSDKDPNADAGDAKGFGFIPGLGRSPGEESGKPLQYSWGDNPMNRGAWWATAGLGNWAWIHMHVVVWQSGYSHFIFCVCVTCIYGDWYFSECAYYVSRKMRKMGLGEEMGCFPGSHMESCISKSWFGAPSHPSLMIFHFVTLPSTA